jgi:hypothetical protein
VLVLVFVPVLYGVCESDLYKYPRKHPMGEVARTQRLSHTEENYERTYREDVCVVPSPLSIFLLC